MQQFEFNPEVCLQMHRNYSTNQMPQNDSNSVKNDQKLIRPGEGTNELAHKFELNPSRGLSADGKKLFDQSEAVKGWEFSGA